MPEKGGLEIRQLGTEPCYTRTQHFTLWALRMLASPRPLPPSVDIEFPIHQKVEDISLDISDAVGDRNIEDISDTAELNDDVSSHASIERMDLPAVRAAMENSQQLSEDRVHALKARLSFLEEIRRDSIGGEATQLEARDEDGNCGIGDGVGDRNEVDAGTVVAEGSVEGGAEGVTTEGSVTKLIDIRDEAMRAVYTSQL